MKLPKRKLAYTEIGHNQHARLWWYANGQVVEVNNTGSIHEAVVPTDPMVQGRIDDEKKRLSMSVSTDVTERQIGYVTKKLAKTYPGYLLFLFHGPEGYHLEEL